mmetsp:Transcript_34653/g.78077  ORF Transcript_34653/g.78077 Transcript_34653/m.78077 type:complete len:726 (-) Transcript_34653:45-2222(-)
MKRLSSALLAFALVCGPSDAFRTPTTHHRHRVPPRRSPSSVGRRTIAPPRPSGATTTSLSVLGLDHDTTQKLIVKVVEKTIDAGVPALFFVGATWYLFQKISEDGDESGPGGMGKRGMGGRGGMFGEPRPLGPVEELYDDIYDDLSGGGDRNKSPFAKLFAGGGGMAGRRDFSKPTSKLNIGIPKQEFLKVTKMNSKYDSYRYSMIKATEGKSAAAAELRSKGFEEALFRSVGVVDGDGKLSLAEGTALLRLERDFLSKGSELLRAVGEMQRTITNYAVVEELKDMGAEPGDIDVLMNETVIDAEIVDGLTQSQKDFFNITSSDNSSESMKGGGLKKKVKTGSGSDADLKMAISGMESLNTKITMLELDFIRDVVDILGPDRADSIRTAVVGNMITGEAGTLLRTLEGRPLAGVLGPMLGHNEHNMVRKKNLYVTRFPGDVTASQLNELREEVTGILRSCKPGDEALLVLQSGGGTVTGYGLAAAQLQRLKSRGVKLTVCVEQVAASGGYMMCCTADRIVASPFAVLGSIGVISEVPNAYDRLKREGIEFQTITAGKFKRTVTPTKKITKEDLAKSEQDIGEIFDLFKKFVASQRPMLDIEDVATGDTWFGEDALSKGLCDELATADDVLLDFVDKGYDVYEIAYEPTPEGPASLLAGLPGSSESTNNDGMFGWKSVLRSAVRSVVSEVQREVSSELSSSVREMNSVERRYMAVDDTASRVQVRD